MKHTGLRRIFSHLLSTPLRTRTYFPPSVLKRIEQTIAASERSHNGEIRFVVESDLNLLQLMQKVTPRQRAIELFSQMRIWDTEANNGVLIYMLLADRDVEIVADRGIHAHVGNERWESICHDMEQHFTDGRYEEGVLRGIEQVSILLRQHFPPTSDDKNELPDAPVLL